MKWSCILIVFSIIMFIIPLSCKDDKGTVSPEVTALYNSGDHIKPLEEYTLENPREWKNVADEHIPKVRMSRDRGKDAILITVPLEKATLHHYIEKIGIMDENKRDVLSKSITRQPNPILSAFFPVEDLPENKKGLKVYIKCNMNDLWVLPLDNEIFDKKNK